MSSLNQHPMSYTTSKDGAEIYYEIEGEGEITLCWIHGAGWGIESWMMQRYLSERYKMVYIELAGHGKSKAKRSRFTMQAFGEDVVAVIEAEDLNKIIFLGWSMGGPVILEAAKLLPKRVIGLIGIDTFFPVPGSIYLAKNEEAMKKFVDPFREDTPNKFWNMCEEFMNIDIKVPQRIQKALKSLPIINSRVFISELEELCYWDILPHLSQVSHPIKAIMAGLNVPQEEREHFKPNIDAVYMEGHGHYLCMADPKSFEKLLIEKIDEIKNMTI